MGVYISKNKVNSKFQIIDFGSINPLGLYDKCCDEYDLNIVRELILNRKISPFYKGMRVLVTKFTLYTRLTR